ncbi:cysteine-rich repeat secretory protein 55-like [Cryptomeria japonica]|uniref:cysteine-rich repeat secretory protein 55-like n=1 Tax=Cryptomeria japonica TaxID=3369 RepID=UPI0025AC1C79|nr:cysteine-rich repeat secretory protein 55-like [Cryptomeria japonica]
MNFPSVICYYRASKCNNASTYTDQSAPQNSGFNTSSHGQFPSKVYGLFQCIGNLSATACSNCSRQANDSIKELCANDIGGRVWMDGCFLRYENYNFTTILDTNWSGLANVNDVTINKQRFVSTTSSLLSNLSDKAYIPANKYLAVGSAKYSTSNKTYGLVQCWRDLSIKDCRSCLVQARKVWQQCCSSKQGVQIMSGSCTVRYELYRFYDSADGSRSLSPSPSPDRGFITTSHNFNNTPNRPSAGSPRSC